MTEYSSNDLDSGEYIGGGAGGTTPPPSSTSEDSPYKLGLNNNIKLAATVAMNTSYHPYSDITSPPHHLNPHHQPPPSHHQPPPSPSDSGSNFGGYHNGSSGGSGVQTPQLTPMDDVVSPPDFHHHSNHLQQHQHLHLNNNNNNNSPIKQCAGCGEKISDRFLLHALDRFWHNSCLKCSCCQRLLADLGTSCFSKGGYILCKKDYSRMFGISGTCSGCGQIIPPNEFVAKTPTNLDNNNKNPFPASHHLFHLKCFACTKCGSVLKSGDRYTMLSGSLLCEQDWHKIIKNTTTATNGTTTTVRKGKVGRPRRTKE